MLLSGKGKHRRGSKAVRIVTLAGVAGVAVAAPLMAAGTASAATSAEWDKVASCESGGNWSINTGNGYYGGLQFSSSTWAAYGGKAYAAQANQASKAQQIAIAEKVLKGQGKGAWPSCGVGLSNSSYNGGGSTTPAKPKPETKPEAAKPAKPAKPASPRRRRPSVPPRPRSPAPSARRPRRRRRPPRRPRPRRPATARTRSRRATPSAPSPRPTASRAAGRSSSSSTRTSSTTPT